MKIWEKGLESNPRVHQFTVGKDVDWDGLLAAADLQGTMAHARMLAAKGFLSVDELEKLRMVLVEMLAQVDQGTFHLSTQAEDIHSHIEFILTQKLGEVGKKIHLGRSRNDQVVLDLKLFFRKELETICHEVHSLFEVLIACSDSSQAILLPGYTHFQVAMPSSFGLWFGAYGESLCNDLEVLWMAFSFCNHNPLGSGAGYGSSLPLDRDQTTDLLGFEGLDVNSVYAQMSRGKTEWALSTALSSLAMTLNKLASDICLYSGQNFGFLSLPDEYTTGSSIMPHKKNPDVFELIRARTNRLIGLPGQLAQLYANLPSGYHRDFQLSKELVFPALEQMHSILGILAEVLPKMTLNPRILESPVYQYISSVDRVHEKVSEGLPFRDAYRSVADEIKAGNFTPGTSPHHTHVGSMGNLGNRRIDERFRHTLDRFPFAQVTQALHQLFLPLDQ